jgi:hypothetical protein
MDIRGVVLADDCLVAIANLRQDGFSSVMLPLQILEGRWSTCASARELADSGVKIVPTREMLTLLPLPVPGLQEREQEQAERRRQARRTQVGEVDNSGDGLENFPPLTREIQQQNEPQEDFSPYLLGHRVFTPHGHVGSRSEASVQVRPPTEILIAASNIDNWTQMQLLSYRIQLSRSLGAYEIRSQSSTAIQSVSTFSRSSSGSGPGITHTLSLISTSCAPSPELPWNPSSLSNNGHMFTLSAGLTENGRIFDSALKCFTLFPDTRLDSYLACASDLRDTRLDSKIDASPRAVLEDQPVNAISLGTAFSNSRRSLQPILSAVEPWSGNIAVRIFGEVKVMYFD